MSFTIQSQNEGSLSADETTPKTFYIPMSHPSTHQPMLPRPSYTTATNSQEESDLQVSDTETENSYTSQTENTNFSSFQDHTTYITRPSACNQPESITEEPYMSTCLSVGSVELHKQSIIILEDETTPTPATNAKISPNQ